MRRVTVTLEADIPGWDDEPLALQQHVGGLLNDARCQAMEKTLAALCKAPETDPGHGDPRYLDWCVYQVCKLDAEMWNLFMPSIRVTVSAEKDHG